MSKDGLRGGDAQPWQAMRMNLERMQEDMTNECNEERYHGTIGRPLV